MRTLSPAGRQIVDDVARRHGFSPPAVFSLLEALAQGNGSMAQFSHPEFGGPGQWLRGGMIMLSDMFNHNLKGRVDALCNELSNLLANQPDLIPGSGFQSQSQADAVSLFVPPAAGTSGQWWPGELGWPASSGAQNGVRYAYFPQARRLAIEIDGQVTVYDTLDHQIGGFGQQQSHGGSLCFTSQYGLIDVASLPVVPGTPAGAPAVPGEADVLATIEKLAGLHAKGILSKEEFAAKKAELLGRL